MCSNLWHCEKTLVVARRLLSEIGSHFARPLEEVREALQASTDAERAIAEFDSEDEGRRISFEPPAEAAAGAVSRRDS